MLFLTKLDFQVRHTENYKLLGSPARLYDFHQMVELLQPSPGAKERILWRLEEPKDCLPYLLIQTGFNPDYGRITECYGERVKLLTKVFRPDLKEGSAFAFRLRANAIKRSSRSPDGIEKAIHFRTEDEALQWLRAKGSSCGFEVRSAEWSKEALEKFSSKGNVMAFSSSKFEGVLEVKHALLFEKALKEGIGRGKAFGFGLMSVAPLK